MIEKITIGFDGNNQVPLDIERLFVEGLLVQGITGTQKSSLVATMLKQIREKENVQYIIMEKDRQFKVLRKYFPMIWVSNDGEIPPVISYARSLGKVIRETGASAMIDLSSFSSWTERQKFIGEYCLGILDVQKEIYSKKCFVVMDEAQLIVPQGYKSHATDPVAELAETGRKYKIRPIMMTQSLSGIEKRVSKQLSTRIVGRTVEDIDRERASKFLTGSKTKLFDEIWNLKDGEFYARGNAISETLVKFKRIDDDSLAGWNSNIVPPLDELGQQWVKTIRSQITEAVPLNELDRYKLENERMKIVIDDLKKEVFVAQQKGFNLALEKMKELVKSK